jgi:hypothetical protein
MGEWWRAINLGDGQQKIRFGLSVRDVQGQG